MAISGLRVAAARNPDFSADGLTLLVHATTIATNAIIEGNIAHVGMITTEGFRDALEIGREGRYDIYDLFLERPQQGSPIRALLPSPAKQS